MNNKLCSSKWWISALIGIRIHCKTHKVVHALRISSVSWYCYFLLVIRFCDHGSVLFRELDRNIRHRGVSCNWDSQIQLELLHIYHRDCSNFLSLMSRDRIGQDGLEGQASWISTRSVSCMLDKFLKDTTRRSRRSSTWAIWVSHLSKGCCRRRTWTAWLN